MSAAPLKILVIDDEPPIRKLLRMGLGTQGYEISDAPNGKGCSRSMARSRIWLFSISVFPTWRGSELLRMIRARNEDVPIVVLSSRGDEAGKVQALDLGADDYVTKPFGMDELLARMRAALRHQLQIHGERPIFRNGELSVDLVRRIVKVADKEVRALTQRVRAITPAGAARRKSAHPQVPAQRALDHAHRRAISPRLCWATQKQNRTEPGTASVHLDGDRRRISTAGA